VNKAIRTWLREPLLHFMLIGALIFGVDQAVRAERSGARTIVVNDAVRSQLIAQFKQGKGREPSEEEMRVLLDRWIYDEVMYREALALGLDKGDPMFRSRLELKLRSMLIDNVVADPPTDDQLRAWMTANPGRYSAPRRYDFAIFPANGDDAAAEKRAREMARRLRSDEEPESDEDVVQFFKNRSGENIAEVFGEAFAEGLVNGGGNRWHPLRSSSGWQVVRLDADKPAVVPDFATLKPQLLADWQRYEQKRLAGEAFREIRARYDIRMEPAK